MIGAPTTAFAVHRDLRNKKLSRKQRRRALAASAILGAAGGAAVGGSIASQTNSVTGQLSKARIKRLENYAKKHKLPTGKSAPLIGTGVGGALGGAYGYYGTKIENQKHKKKKDRSDPLGTAVLTGAVGAYGGHQLGHLLRSSQLSSVAHKKTMSQYQPGKLKDYLSKRWARSARSRAQQDYANRRPGGRPGGRSSWWGGRSSSGEAPSAHVRDTGIPSWLRGVTTKAEAKRRYRDKVRIHHPDKPTGNTRTMQDINAEWDSFSKHHFDKLGSAYRAFLEELIEIEKTAGSLKAPRKRFLKDLYKLKQNVKEMDPTNRQIMSGTIDDAFGALWHRRDRPTSRISRKGHGDLRHKGRYGLAFARRLDSDEYF